jgi:hypothetical protein
MDLRAAKILSHRRNIQRYNQLLAMDITELERKCLHKRIVEEQTELEHWELRSEETGALKRRAPRSLPGALNNKEQ